MQSSDGSTGGDDDSPTKAGLWTQLVNGLSNLVTGLLGAFGLGGLVSGLSPAIIVGLVAGLLIVVRIILP